MEAERTCALCDGPIQPGEATMTDAEDGRVAHSGCVYRDESPADRDRWAPAEA